MSMPFASSAGLRNSLMHPVEPHLIPRVPLRLDMSRRAALDSVRLEQVGPRGQSTLSDRCISPRLLSRAEAANYCGLSCQGFSTWVKIGRLPGPIAGTARWDLRAIDAALDLLSGIADRDEGGVDSSFLDQWKIKNARSS